MEGVLITLGDLYRLFVVYWYTAGRNTMPHLALFMLLLLLLFFMRHRREYNHMRYSVGKIPLVVGGWGTRGKSGTERKKCALFECMGLSVYSKTTGCEAMFLHSIPGQNAQELYLFRPYDKATIWEQGRCVDLACKLEAQVMCWECMALNPAYVEILQQEWMQDRIATLTNTYPDHEDIQGPAGRDLPYVMNRFIPRDGVVFTAEEQMVPILREEALRKNTELHQIHWKDVFYLTPDVMDRYPYKVHPENMALVLQLAESLGVPRDFALKEIADKIVPDIGVLKVFPEGRYLGRHLYFINGCSANERRGFLSNWVRMGYDTHNPKANPERWIVPVVNNRADRIPRSKVFADIMVMDVSVHRIVAIGTNLSGLKGYIADSLTRRIDSLELPQAFRNAVPSDADLDAALRDVLGDLKWECYTEDDVRQSIGIMLRGVNIDDELVAQVLADYSGTDAGGVISALITPAHVNKTVLGDIVAFASMFEERWKSYRTLFAEMRSRLEQSDFDGALHHLHETFRKGFMERLLIIDDPLVTGDQIVHYIAKRVPPGFETHLMGTQNIKGTGLDFVYRWLALEKTVDAAKNLFDPLDSKRQEALDHFATSKEYGLLNTEVALDALNEATGHPYFQNMSGQKQLRKIIENIHKSRLKLEDLEVTEEADEKKKIKDFLLTLGESLFEIGESKRRVKTANHIYDLLCAGLISHDKAAEILRGITKEQKGGWLPERIKKWRKRLAS